MRYSSGLFLSLAPGVWLSRTAQRPIRTPPRPSLFCIARLQGVTRASFCNVQPRSASDKEYVQI